MTQEQYKESLTEESRKVLQKKMERMKEEQHDLGLQVKECDLFINELLDLRCKFEKKRLKERRHEFMSQMNNNALSIVELERVLYNNGYVVTNNAEVQNGG